jgi:hypothetical protein
MTTASDSKKSSKAARQSYDSATYRSGKGNGNTHIFSSNMPHRAPVLCYIAGIECPIVAITVNFGVWQIPDAQVTMFPDPQLQRFGVEDRVPLVAFYLDEYIEPTAPRWRLLFDGEIVGWSYTNTPLGRSLSFSCVADISIFTQLYLFYMTTLSTIAGGYLDASQSAEMITQARAVFPYSLFREGLITNTNAATSEGTSTVDLKTAEGKGLKLNMNTNYIKRPYDFAYNVIRWVISNDIDKKERCIPAVNFFSRWIKRTKFHHRWVALPFLDEMYDFTAGANGEKMATQPDGIFPVLRAVQAKEAVGCVENTVAAQNSNGSIFTLLKSVLDTVYMEIAMLPTAPAVACQSDGAIVGPTIVSGIKGSRAEQDRLLGQETKSKYTTRIANYFVKPQCIFALPPACNVIFPSMTPQIQYTESYMTQPTRLYFQDDTLVNLMPMAGNDANQSKLISVKLARAWPVEADTKFQDHLTGKSPQETGKNLLIYPEEFFKGPVTARYPAPSWLMYLAAHYQTVKDPSSVPASQNAKDMAVELGTGTSLTDTSLYVLYAKYEYFRQRYEKRNGAVICAFQPYLVPGFPSMIFDDFQSQMHLMGYLMNVTHSISSGSVQTSANYSYATTLSEFFQNVKNEMENPGIAGRKGLATAAAPLDPIIEVRNVTQHFYRADQFYQALFHQRKKPESGHKAVFDYRDLLAFVNADGTLSNIFIEGMNEEALTKVKDDFSKAKEVLNSYINNPLTRAKASKEGTGLPEIKKAAALAGFSKPLKDNEYTVDVAKGILAMLLTLEVGYNNPQVKTNLTSQKEVTPKPGFEDYFDSYDAAMKYCARPICTLDDYIKFIGGTPEGPHDDYAYTEGGNIPSARYYDSIKKYVGRTAALDKKITADQKGLGTTPTAVPLDFPDMREEWYKTIKAYRAGIYARMASR